MLTPLLAALGAVTVVITTPDPEGVMSVQLCRQETFMNGPCEHRVRRPAAARDAFVFDNVAPGRWAVMVWRDPEGDGEMRTRLFGIPAEPVAISNNPPARFGPPRFEDAAVQIGAEPFTIEIAVD